MDVVDVQARAVEGAVGGDRAQHLADRPRPRSSAASALSTTSAAAPIPMIMPCRRRSNGIAASSTTSSVAAAPLARKPGAEPLDQMVGGNIVRRDHDHPAAAAGADPILRHRDRLGGAGARRIELRIRTARADQLGELRVPHGQHAEQEAPVEVGTAPSRCASCSSAMRRSISCRRAGWPFGPTRRSRKSSSTAS